MANQRMSANLSDQLVQLVSTRPSARTVGTAVGAALGLFVVGTCLLVTTALSQLKSMKADVAAAREELLLAKEQTGSLERRLEAALQAIDHQQIVGSIRQAPGDRGSEKPGGRLPFRLTPEETQLIRTYIKTPVVSQTTGTIGVDTELRNAALLPLPAQIMAKAPRLEGARFTIDRNGAIVISLRNSRTADAIIQPN
jgi:hypothetical protein